MMAAVKERAVLSFSRLMTDAFSRPPGQGLRAPKEVGMSGSMRRRNVVLAAVLAALALSCVCAVAGEGPRTGIYLHIGGINGTVGACGAFAAYGPGWIVINSLTIGGQTIQPSALWVITPPYGIKEMTLTKNTDSASSQLSAAFGLPVKPNFPAQIDLCEVGANGAVKKVSRYVLLRARISSFAATPPKETLVLTFDQLKMGMPPPPTIVYEVAPTATPTPMTRRLAAPAGDRRLRAGATPTPH
jgi:hypothetical protein